MHLFCRIYTWNRSPDRNPLRSPQPAGGRSTTYPRVARIGVVEATRHAPAGFALRVHQGRATVVGASLRVSIGSNMGDDRAWLCSRARAHARIRPFYPPLDPSTGVFQSTPGPSVGVFIPAPASTTGVYKPASASLLSDSQICTVSAGQSVSLLVD